MLEAGMTKDLQGIELLKLLVSAERKGSSKYIIVQLKKELKSRLRTDILHILREKY